MDEPERKEALEYARPEERSTVGTVMGAMAGVGGYLGLAVGTFFLVLAMNINLGPGPFVTLAGVLLLPLAVMLALSYGLKSRSMLISTWITFGVVALSCGTCFALVN